jgi:hypothetical protein
MQSLTLAVTGNGLAGQAAKQRADDNLARAVGLRLTFGLGDLGLRLERLSGPTFL